MRIHEIIKKELNNIPITGKDGNRYIIRVIGDSIFSIYVMDAMNPFRRGFLPELRDLGDEIYSAGFAKFMEVQGNGLYKEVMRLISEAIPAGKKYRDSLMNAGDQQYIADYVERNDGSLSVKDALEMTCVGHVILATKIQWARSPCVSRVGECPQCA